MKSQAGRRARVGMLLISITFRRYGCYKDLYDRIETWDGGVDGFTKGYKYFGAQFNGDGSVTWREWAPGAHSLHLQGEFSQ